MLQILKQLYRIFNPRYKAIFVDYADQLGPRYGLKKPYHSQLHSILQEHRESIYKHVKNVQEYIPWLNELPINETEKSIPYINNGYMPAMDLLYLYMMIDQYKPHNYIEVGCGTSTRVAYSAKTQRQIKTNIIAIDPSPRLPVQGLVDIHICETMQSLDISWWNRWTKDDLLFIDNSHRALPGSDVTVFFLEVLPILPSGMLLHIHDIYWPYDYPQEMCERGYNEQYLLGQAILLQPERYEILAANHWVTTDEYWKDEREQLWEKTGDKKIEKAGCSFWCRIR